MKELCELPDLSYNEEVKTLKRQVIESTSDISLQSFVDNKLIVKTNHWILAYPRTQKAYSEAIQKFDSGEYQRNTLDDMRFALEMLINDLLGNERSLENNKTELGKILKQKKVSDEYRNMFTYLISYFCLYQNDHIKYNNDIKESELEITIEFTSTVMKFLIITFQ